MTTPANRVMKDPMQLTEEERAELAARVIESLEAASNEDVHEVQAAWAAEIERRCAALDAGTTGTTTWKAARRQIETAIRRS